MNKQIELSQQELIIIVTILAQVQLPYKDSKQVVPLIEKLDKYVDKPKPEPVKITPQDHKEAHART